MMRFAGLILALALGLSGTTAQACTCATIPDVEAAFAQADIVFLGTAGSAAPLAGEHMPGSRIDERTRFRVLEVWKGSVPSRIEVMSSRHPRLPGCGLSSFQRGLSYLVYAVADDSGGFRVQQGCSRTAREIDAAKDFQVLDQLVVPAE